MNAIERATVLNPSYGVLGQLVLLRTDSGEVAVRARKNMRIISAVDLLAELADPSD